jgi:YggT family protein
MTSFLRTFVELLVAAAWLLVLARVVVSWVDPACRNDWSRRIVFLTEPVLGPVRRLLPSTGMLDLAPLVVLLALGFLLRLVSA